jgi:YD repeat-containing protein
MTETIPPVQVCEICTYDAARRLMAVRDGEGAVTTYGSDDASRLTTATDPETGLTTT